jgi:hypothetical protein
MKKIFTSIIALLATVSVWAYDFPGFEWSAGCDFTTSYLWRGMNYGGMSFQPDLSIGYGGLSVEAWANIGAVNNSFKEFNPELDVTLSYKILGLSVGVTHYYYFDGTKYFDYRKPSVEKYVEGDYATNQTEVFAKFELGEIVEKIPLTVTWSTFVGGDDWRPNYDENDSIIGLSKAYSSYLEFSYEAELPLGFSLTPTVGCSPWASFYNDYTNKFSVNNISLKLNWELNVKDVFAIDVYGIAMLNTAGINKENIWPSARDSYANRRLNLAAGIGIWF